MVEMWMCEGTVRYNLMDKQLVPFPYYMFTSKCLHKTIPPTWLTTED